MHHYRTAAARQDDAGMTRSTEPSPSTTKTAPKASWSDSLTKEEGLRVKRECISFNWKTPPPSPFFENLIRLTDAQIDLIDVIMRRCQDLESHALESTYCVRRWKRPLQDAIRVTM